MTNTKMTLVDWLDDLCVRFIVNLPNEELQSVERICFQIEEAQWFYEDFIRPLDPNNLPSMHLRKFSQLIFQHCPLFSAYSEALHQQAYEQFLAYKTRVPVRGAIMLNEDMTHAVLVKGWKKGAKWSFPRGKINKEETDLDCAVREVWEETGYDLHEADLVEPDENMKKITVTMREQSMMLYVFRGVPMDTYFEPRTRKEISKIDWYKLTDLPTLRRKNQVQQQGQGQELIKESSFYMVAPFLGPLRAWIKQQHKLDKQRARNSAHVAAPPVAMTDDEDIQPEVYETTANEAVPVAGMPTSDNLASLVAQLGRGRPGESLPEVANQQQHQQQSPAADPAAELKRLLSVGVGMQSPPVEAPSIPTPTQYQQANPLLALFHQRDSQQSPRMPPPRTPFDQAIPSPLQPSSPHGQHQPRQPQMGNMGPPPSFPYHQQQQQQQQQMSYRGPPQSNGMPAPPMNLYGQPSQHRDSHFPPQPPNMQQAFDQRNPQMVHDTSNSQFAGDHGRPAIPSASNLPAPNLNPHALGLLNSFKNNDQRPAQQQPSAPTYQGQQSAHDTPRIQHPLPQHRPHDLASPQGSYAPSPPQFQSPALNVNFQPEQPTPRSLHQDSLLTLFRGATPVASPEPVELSAHPKTPGYMAAQPASNASKAHNADLLNAFGVGPPKKSVTQAIVSGPVNVPDFETMKKHSHPVSGSSRGPSPQMPFMPQQILKRSSASNASRASSDATVVPLKTVSQNATKAPDGTQAAFKPQILKRPQQEQQQAPGKNATLALAPKQKAHQQGLLDMLKGPSPQSAPAQPVHPTRTSRTPAPPVGHSQGLLDMFKGAPPNPPPAQPAPMHSRLSPAPSADHKQDLLNIFKRPSPSPQAAPAQPTQSLRSSLSPAPPATHNNERRESTSVEKSNLLALFNKPSPQIQGSTLVRAPPPPLKPSRSPAAVGGFPPRPMSKMSMSGVISPVSPLHGGGGSQTSPAGVANRSRISSFGGGDEGVQLPLGVSNGGGGAFGGTVGGLRSTGQTLVVDKDKDAGKSPVDKTFLLGFLENVARRG
ncbi:hypothetical protein T440DRAFT_470494 [Plenodomus tracheiphilus IPT5]|uniref:Nudix hydrolase domain-containing protein n=1 Tax=Plenodomus tracheiphilus IPT5 TaxID=1408161 RepID=A0A6A7AYK9_9PLEO|nr:hypothetical protein T440DRAFT_470494 [Plenodomus tracheiphilus IPT5]